MICTAEDNYGMDGKVNLPNFSENTDWRGLEDLYSVDDRIYLQRKNYRLSMDDWTNYLKDVDRMFALLNHVFEINKTEGNIAAGNEFSGAWPIPLTWVEITSVESSEESSGMAAEERQPEGAADFGIRDFGRKAHSQEMPELNNNIPEQNLEVPAPRSNSQAEIWMENKGFESPEIEISGNGWTELETRHSSILQPSRTLQKDLLLDSDPAGDLFEEQMYLHLSLNGQSDHKAENHSTADRPTSNMNMERFLSENEHLHTRGIPQIQNIEGSASFPLSSN